MPTMTIDIAPGVTEFVVPDNYVIGTMFAELWGPGGRGLNGTAGNGGGSGGGGAYANGHVDCLPGDVLQTTVNIGSSLTNTELQTADLSTHLLAAYGSSGASGLASNSIGETCFSGSTCLAGTSSFGAGGGGSAYPTGNANPVLGRNGGLGYGNGGDGAANVGPAAAPGHYPGGGGGGGWGTSTLKNGASGADGKLTLTWEEHEPLPPSSPTWWGGPMDTGTTSTRRRFVMTPTQPLLTSLSGLLGNDSTTLAGALKITLIKAPFTPSPTILPADLTAADFNGSTPISLTAGARPDNFDPATGDRLVNLVPPAGGYLWTTVDATSLPQTIYGVSVGTGVLPAGNLFGTFLLDTPVTLTGADQQVLVPDITFRLLASGIQ